MNRTIILAALIATTPAAAWADIGVLAAVNRDMTGERPGESARPIFIKEQLIQNERIETSGDGGGQVLFLDQTSLTVSPNSSIVLDKYVYDPEAGTGEIGVSILRGAMRFVGGRITKETAATIRTPTATIGIRGGMSNMNVGPESTIYMHVAGFSSTITTASDTLTITREGGLAEISNSGGLEYLGVASPDVVTRLFGRGGAGKGGGGAEAGGGGSVASGTGIAGQDGIVDAAAISTVGERQNADFGELSVELEDAPNEELAMATVMEAVGDDMMASDLPTFVAAGVFSGTATVEGVATQANDLPIEVVYSQTLGEGIALFALPETGDELAFVDGVDLAGGGDQILLKLADGFALVPASGIATALGGDPAGTRFEVASRNLSGGIQIDYTRSQFTQFLQSFEGQVSDTPIVDITEFSQLEGAPANQLQQELDQSLNEVKQIFPLLEPGN